MIKDIIIAAVVVFVEIVEIIFLIIIINHQHINVDDQLEEEITYIHT